MTREEKAIAINELTEKLSANTFFYLTDSSGMTVEQVGKLRRMCFEKQIEMKVVKNTLLRKAMERVNDSYSPLFDSLHGTTSIMFSETGNLPAKLLKEFYKQTDKLNKPVLKAAYIDTAVYVGENQLDALAKIKSKEEVIGDVIGLLQSPMKNVIGALKSSGSTIAGLVKALEERAQ